MLTSIRLSNISYNSEDFLKRQLNSLLYSRKISFWCYIKHKKEEDNLKDHIHLYIVPNLRLETVDLDELFLEPVPDNDIPLKCMLWDKVTSKYDWLLYVKHDSLYLRAKYAEDKKFHYNKEDFVFSDKDIFEEFYYGAYHEFNFWKSKKYQDFLQNGISAKELVRNGYVDFKDMTNFHYLSVTLGGG